jgi:hypothetical protein
VATPLLGEALGGLGAELGLEAAPGGRDVDTGNSEGIPGSTLSGENLAVPFGTLDEGAVGEVDAGKQFGPLKEGCVFKVPKEAGNGEEELAGGGLEGGPPGHGEADNDAVLCLGGSVDEDPLSKDFLRDSVFAGEGADGLGAGLGAKPVEGANGGGVDHPVGISPHLAAEGFELRLDVNGNGHVNLR